MTASVASVLSGENPLHVVLQHLSGREGNPQQYRLAARGLHLANKHYHAASRATLRQLCLYKYWKGLLSAYPDAEQRPPLLPWSLLEACPAVTWWELDIEQLQDLGDDGLQRLMAAANHLKKLTITQCNGYFNGCQHIYDPQEPSDVQLHALGRLLRACSRLEELDLRCGVAKPWLVLDSESSNLSNATAPALPLRSWSCRGCGPGLCSLLTAWVAQQQQQLGSTLRSVQLRCHDAFDCSSLAALRNLKELRLGVRSRLSPAALSSMTRLTQLHLLGKDDIVKAVGTVTGLKDLSLHWFSGAADPAVRTPHMPALKQLSSLVISRSGGDLVLSQQLGEQLPSLERLDAEYSGTGGWPSSLTRLSCLTLRGFSSAADLSLPSSLRRLRELRIIGADCYSSIRGIGKLTGLELLDVDFAENLMSDSATTAAGASGLAVLHPLTRLRHLCITLRNGSDPAGLTVLGALQLLTSLRMGYEPVWAAVAGRQPTPATHKWALSEPLPALRELSLRWFPDACSLAALSPWLVQLTALTCLQAVGCAVEGGDGQLCLPAQLQALQLRDIQGGSPLLHHGLLQLSALRMLSVCGGVHRLLSQLPSWLSQLRRLEALDLYDTGVVTEQEVLAQLPLLSCVRLPMEVLGVVVLGRATHLHFGDVNCFWRWWCGSDAALSVLQ